ncbi:MAG: LCP family protein [Coriobacteriales bacterium]|nr:LCP family protein [Coriobacteriales bacterium]
MSEDTTRSGGAHFKSAGTPTGGESAPNSGATYDPFVSEEDPYPYSDYTPDADDTGEYLKALESGTGGNTAVQQPHSATENINVYYDVNRYHQASKPRGLRPLYIVLISLVVVALGIAGAVAVYVNNINSKLTAEVTPELREELVTPVEPEDPFYLLLLGVDKDQSRWSGDDSADYGQDEHAYRSDSILLCRIDPPAVKVTMVSIHRDTLVNLGEYGQQKINAAYAFGGPALATKTVSEFAGVPIAHYAEIDLDRFIEIVDQVGGVTVTLPVPVYDPEYTQLNLPAGEQTLDGTQAALLCRCRHGYDAYGDGDVYRAANQRMIIAAVIKKVLKSDPVTMIATVSSMADSVTTDLDVASIVSLAQQMATLDVDNGVMTGMAPTDGVLIDGVWYEMCLTEQWQKMMARVDQGLPPYEDGVKDSTAGIAGSVNQEADKAATGSASGTNTTQNTSETPAQEAPPQEETPEPVVEETYHYEEYYPQEYYTYNEYSYDGYY